MKQANGIRKKITGYETLTNTFTKKIRDKINQNKKIINRRNQSKRSKNTNTSDTLTYASDD